MKANTLTSDAVIENFTRSEIMFDMQSTVRRTQASLDLLLQFCQTQCENSSGYLTTFCDRVESDIRCLVYELAHKYLDDESASKEPADVSPEDRG